jgi:hypothetical protein
MWHHSQSADGGYVTGLSSSRATFLVNNQGQCCMGDMEQLRRCRSWFGALLALSLSAE